MPPEEFVTWHPESTLFGGRSPTRASTQQYESSEDTESKEQRRPNHGEKPRLAPAAEAADRGHVQARVQRSRAHEELRRNQLDIRRLLATVSSITSPGFAMITSLT